MTVGELIGDKYRLEAILGAGGMGVVFLARHLQLDGQVAIKVLSGEAILHPQATSRFHREAQAAAKLKSDHVVRVFDVGVHSNGMPYIVMEYLEGGDLSQLLRASGPLPVWQAVELLLQTCAAIADAHRAGIIHRDLKPSNLFCVPRPNGALMIKVVDFGISKLTGAAGGAAQGVTVTGNVVGSPSYMSPEQMRTPNRVDERTDIWSLGVVLYETLTDRLPFPAETFPEVCLKVAQDPPVPPRSYRADLPLGLEAVILKCLEKNREDRYASVTELASALMAFAPRDPRSTSLAAGKTSFNAAKPAGRGALPRTLSWFGSLSLSRPGSGSAQTPLAKSRQRRSLAIPWLGLAAILVLGVFFFVRGRVETEVSSAVPSSEVAAAPSEPVSPRPAPTERSPTVEPAPTESLAAEPTLPEPAPPEPAPPTNPSAKSLAAAAGREPTPAPTPKAHSVTARSPATASAPAAVPPPQSAPAASKTTAPERTAKPRSAPASTAASTAKVRAERDAKSSTWTR